MDRLTPWWIASASCVVALFIGGCSSDDSESTEAGNSGTDGRVGTVPADAQEIFDKAAYGSARWIYRVQPLGSEEPTLAADDESMVLLGSTAKLYTVGSAYETLGSDKTITTPVYKVGDQLALVAMGDLAMGGRGAIDGEFKNAPIDKVYANAIPGASIPDGDPLAGLRDLAEQTAASGVKQVSDVQIDDRLFQPYDAGGTGGGAVSPIIINDNQVDIKMTPTKPGEQVKVTINPKSDLFEINVDVETVKGDGKGEEAGQEIDLMPGEDPTKLTVTGTLEAGADPAVRSLIPPDPALFAKTLFISELKKAGVKVKDPGAENDVEALPAFDGYSSDDEVASLESPPIERFGSMILTTSYNQGADAMLCYLAIDAGSDECEQGLNTVNSLINKAGIGPAEVVLVDGHGGDPASATPAATNAWLQWTTEQDWGADLEAGLPVLGERGSLASSGTDSPAKGKVKAKTGTSVRPFPPDSRLFVNTQGLAGFLDTDDGRQIFTLYVSGAIFDEVIPGLFEANGDVADVSAAFQQGVPFGSGG